MHLYNKKEFKGGIIACTQRAGILFQIIKTPFSVTLPPTIPVPVTDKQRDTKASKQTAALVIGICIAIVAVGLAAVALFVMRRK